MLKGKGVLVGWSSTLLLLLGVVAWMLWHGIVVCRPPTWKRTTMKMGHAQGFGNMNRCFQENWGVCCRETWVDILIRMHEL
jgi:hypothetical protein